MNVFTVGQKVYMATYGRHEKAVLCPDCAGSKKVKVTLGDGTEIMIDCGGCDPGGYQPSTGYIKQYDYSVEVIERTVTGVTQSLQGVHYELDNFGHSSYFTGTNDTCFATEAEALESGEKQRIEHEAAENARLMAKTKDHKSWSFNYDYHRKCAKDAEKQMLYHQQKAEICKAKA